MRNVLLFLAFVLFSCSCKSIKMGTEPASHPQVNVKLKDGRTIGAQDVSASNKYVIADGKEYKKKEVASYSDGKYIYLNTNKFFAKKTFEGDITVYRYSTRYTSTSYNSTGGLTTTSHKKTIDFIQPSSSNAIMLLNYKNMKKVIPQNEPAYSYLHTYKMNRIIGNGVFVGGLGLIFTGAAMLINNSGVKSSSGKAGTAGGVITLCTGVVGFYTGAAIKGLNKRNLHRAVAKHNGVLK